MFLPHLSASLTIFALCYAQQVPLQPQSDTWNSTYKTPADILAGTNISDVQAANIDVAINFERSNWATGSVTQDEFYEVPSDASSLPPGSIIKVQPFVNTTTYTLPPNTALSRILYTTRDVHNKTVPASAFVLWPFMPLTFPNLSDPKPGTNSTKYPVVGWGHGTSGVFSECGPSHIRNLWYQFSAPYELALSGYVVVGPDYQGLGANTSFDGSQVVHPYLVGSAAADDLFYAIEAAQSAFADKLSKEFVIMGHSQGGNAAWASAVRQNQTPVDRYLGAIAGSPTTNLTGIFALLGQAVPPSLPMLGAQAVQSFDPNFDLSSMLTDEGLARFNLAKEESMCNSAMDELLSDFPASDNGALLRANWSTLPVVQQYFNATNGPGSLPIGGPMLVLQGTNDPAVPYQFTDIAVAQTCAVDGGQGIQYARFEGVSHVPVLFAGRRVWLDWLARRFASVGRKTACPNECVVTNYTSGPWPIQNYQPELGYYLELATQAYQVA